MATRPGLEAGDHEALTFSTASRSNASAPGAAQAAAWGSVIEHAMVSLADGLGRLMDAGLPPPDEVGYELEQEGSVMAEAELAWLQRKLVLLMPTHAANAAVWEANGWKTLIAQDEWQQKLADELGNRNDQQTEHQEGNE
jgi:DEAD/DEAH box helicase domain-containing protein